MKYKHSLERLGEHQVWADVLERDDFIAGGITADLAIAVGLGAYKCDVEDEVNAGIKTAFVNLRSKSEGMYVKINGELVEDVEDIVIAFDTDVDAYGLMKSLRFAAEALEAIWEIREYAER